MPPGSSSQYFCRNKYLVTHRFKDLSFTRYTCTLFTSINTLHYLSYQGDKIRLFWAVLLETSSNTFFINTHKYHTQRHRRRAAPTYQHTASTEVEMWKNHIAEYGNWASSTARSDTYDKGVGISREKIAAVLVGKWRKSSQINYLSTTILD